ncbi:MAG: shikimate kinase [Myxococcota bacterium]
MAERSGHPALAKNLVLIGGRGCGKSSVAKRIARANKNFMLFSLDALIRYEAEARTVSQIVGDEGWPGFRARERAVVEKIARFEGGALVDTGGGVIADLDADGQEVYSAAKVDALRRHGFVIYLERSTRYLERRTSGDPNRPKLSGTESFGDIMERRDPWYRRAAHAVLPCQNLSKPEIAEKALELFYQDLGL